MARFRRCKILGGIVVLTLLNISYVLRPGVWTQACPAQQHTKGTKNEVLPKGTVDLLSPILILRYRSLEECGSGQSYHCADGAGFAHEEARSKEIERLVGRLIKNSSPAADRAIVVLLYYDVGPSEAEDLLSSVISRGRRELPYLLEYKDSAPRLPGKNYPDSMLNGREFRLAMFDHAISSIRRKKPPTRPRPD